MTNLLNLPLDQFRGYLAEGNYSQARRDELMRAYRAQNSLSGLLDRYGEEGLEGKNVSTFFPVAGPGGMSIFDALKSGQLQTRFKDYASDALGGVLGALENAKASYDGTLPQADFNSAAMGTAGLAMGGGGVVAGRLPDGAVAANIPVMQGRSRQGLTDFFNPDGVSWGTDSKSTAEQFAGKDAGLVYKYNDEGKLEVSEADSYLPGQVYDLNYDLENPMQVPIKDTLWTREKELAKIAEAKAKGHDGLKIVHGTPDADGKYPKTDYVAFDPSQVSTVNANASKSAGLLAASLPEPRNAGEAMAQRILEMRAAGKAGDVTDEMMAQADPQYMFNNTPLDMSEAARMARAEDAGFDVDLPLYHGTPASDLSYFDAEKFGAYGDPGLRGLGVYSTDNPLLAKSYADRPRFDHSIKTESVLKPARVPEEELSRGIIPLLSRAQNRADILNLPLMDRAKLSGISGSAYNERLPQNDGVKYTYTSKDPSSEFVDFNPANIRSRFARFDPEFSHLSNLSAANASAPVGLLAAQPSTEDELRQYLMQRGLLQ